MGWVGDPKMKPYVDCKFMDALPASLAVAARRGDERKREERRE